MNTTMLCATADMMHPYECGGGCVHCRQVLDDDHDPVLCAQCHWDDPEELCELRAHMAAVVGDARRLRPAVEAFRAWVIRHDVAGGLVLVELDRLLAGAA